MKLSVKIAGIAFAFALVAAATSTTAEAAFTRDLTLGSTGADVIELQTWLEAKGFLTIPAGTSKGYFGVLTQSALGKYQMKAGIIPTAGYFGPITRAALALEGTSIDVTPGTNPGTNNGGLKGGAGDIQKVSKTTSGTETTLGEGKSEDVLGFDVEADDNSDLAITSVRVEIGITGSGSTRLNRYLDEATIMLDGDEVGNVDVSDFSRDGATSTATISLDDAVVKAGKEGRFYLNLTARDSINDDELAGGLIVSVNRIRFEDASGAILTSNDVVSTTADFEDSSANDDARIKKTSDTRDAGLLKIDASNKSDEFDILTFQFDVDDNSSDLMITKLPVKLTIKNGSSTSTLDVNKFINELFIEVDGETYDDFDFNDTSVAAGATETVTATFNIDEDDLVVSEGDVVDGVVFVTFGKQAGNYAQGSTIMASVTGSDLDAENNEGDVFAVSGTVNGEVQTVQIAAATIDNFKFTPATGTNVTTENNGSFIDFYFTVEAEDEDFDVLAASIVASTSGNATTSAGTLTLNTGDADGISGGFRVLDGDDAVFRVRYIVSGTSGQLSEVKVTSVAGQEVPTSSQRSGTLSIK